MRKVVTSFTGTMEEAAPVPLGSFDRSLLLSYLLVETEEAAEALVSFILQG